MKKPVIVQKYGGTSVATPEKMMGICRHIVKARQAGYRLVVVISAMGKFTDQLMHLAKSVHQEPPARELDMLLTAGERVSMSLLSMALASQDIPAVSFTGSQSGILTDNQHGNAKIIGIKAFRVAQALERGDVAIVAGYQGVCPETKEITTLGRGGSDLTAVALAVHLNAQRCEIYTDVPGVYSANPQRFQGARLIPRLDATLALLLARSGAEVLYSRSVSYARKYQLPLSVRSSFEIENPGTVLTYDDQRSSQAGIVGFGVLKQMSMMTGVLGSLLQDDDFLDELHCLKPNLEFENQKTFICAPSLLQEKKEVFKVVYQHLSLVTIVGVRLNELEGLVEKIEQLLGCQAVTVTISDSQIGMAFPGDVCLDRLDRIHQGEFFIG